MHSGTGGLLFSSHQQHGLISRVSLRPAAPTGALHSRTSHPRLPMASRMARLLAQLPARRGEADAASSTVAALQRQLAWLADGSGGGGVSGGGAGSGECHRQQHQQQWPWPLPPGLQQSHDDARQRDSGQQQAPHSRWPAQQQWPAGDLGWQQHSSQHCSWHEQQQHTRAWGPSGSHSVLRVLPARQHASLAQQWHARHFSSTGPGDSSSSTASTGTGASSPGSSWMDRVLPARVLPYAQLMRLDKPVGSWLLAWPSLWCASAWCAAAAPAVTKAAAPTAAAEAATGFGLTGALLPLPPGRLRWRRGQASCQTPG